MLVQIPVYSSLDGVYCYIHQEDHAQCELCDSRDIIYIFLVGQVLGLVENLNIGIFSDTRNVINVKICIMVLNPEHSLCLTF